MIPRTYPHRISKLARSFTRVLGYRGVPETRTSRWRHDEQAGCRWRGGRKTNAWTEIHHTNEETPTTPDTRERYYRMPQEDCRAKQSECLQNIMEWTQTNWEKDQNSEIYKKRNNRDENTSGNGDRWHKSWSTNTHIGTPCTLCHFLKRQSTIVRGLRRKQSSVQKVLHLLYKAKRMEKSENNGKWDWALLVAAKENSNTLPCIKKEQINNYREALTPLSRNTSKTRRISGAAAISTCNRKREDSSAHLELDQFPHGGTNLRRTKSRTPGKLNPMQFRMRKGGDGGY